MQMHANLLPHSPDDLIDLYTKDNIMLLVSRSGQVIQCQKDDAWSEAQCYMEGSVGGHHTTHTCGQYSMYPTVHSTDINIHVLYKIPLKV